MLSLTPPPSAPQRGDRTTFASRVDAFVAWLITFVGQLTALIAGIGTLVAGGANKIPYKVDLGTTMGDPTAGWLRLNSATQNASTAMVVDLLGSDNIDYTSLLASFGTSTSAVLGQIRIEKLGDASTFLIFSLAAMTSPSGYRQFTVSCIGYSSMNPFGQGDPVVLSLTKNGDKGDPGTQQAMTLREQVASGTTGMPMGSGLWYSRTLNSTQANTIPGASLGTAGAGIFTLPAGTYVVDASSPCSPTQTGTFHHQTKLTNVTAGTFDYGTSEYANLGSGYMQTRSMLRTQFTLIAPANFRLDHYANLTANGGYPAGSGNPEVYAEVRIVRLGP